RRWRLCDSARLRAVGHSPTACAGPRREGSALTYLSGAAERRNCRAFSRSERGLAPPLRREGPGTRSRVASRQEQRAAGPTGGPGTPIPPRRRTMIEHKSTNHEMVKEAGAAVAHLVAIAVGAILMILGIGLGVGLVTLPLAFPVGFGGLFL